MQTELVQTPNLIQTKPKNEEPSQSQQDIAVIYLNFMEIMNHMTCTIDRIRETQVSSRHGLPANLTEILTNFYKDDVLQPKPNPKLRL